MGQKLPSPRNHTQIAVYSDTPNLGQWGSCCYRVGKFQVRILLSAGIEPVLFILGNPRHPPRDNLQQSEAQFLYIWKSASLVGAIYKHFFSYPKRKQTSFCAVNVFWNLILFLININVIFRGHLMVHQPH